MTSMITYNAKISVPIVISLSKTIPLDTILYT